MVTQRHALAKKLFGILRLLGRFKDVGGELGGSDVARQVLKLREEMCGRRDASDCGKTFRTDNTFLQRFVGGGGLVVWRIHVIVDGEREFRANRTTKLVAFKDVAHVLATYAPVAADLKDKHALAARQSVPCGQ